MSSFLLLCLFVFVGVSSEAPSAQDQTRIVDGTESSQGKWPFFVGIFYKRARWIDPRAPYCGAVIWDKDTLITAAHCVSSDPVYPDHRLELSNVFVYMGYNDWTEPKHKEYMFNVREIMHPNYDKQNPFHEDIALIFLNRSIDFDGINNKVQCVCDPEPLELLNTSACVAMGWGRDNAKKKPTNLMEVVLPILDNEICNGFAFGDFDPNHHICAGYVGKKTSGICTGDSGGPLVCPQLADPSKYSLVGVICFGFTPPACGYNPSYFTYVDFHLRWISRVRSKTSNVQTPPPRSSSFWQRWFGKFGSFGKWW